MAIADDRPLRADARRNRAAIVKAARAIFARDGRSAQMDDIARRARVGVGTVYRHFPTKEALFSALAEDRFSQIAGLATEALAVEDPWAGLEQFLRRCAELQASDRALSEVLQEEPGLVGAAVTRSGLREAAEELVRRGQAAGVVRSDLRGGDLGMISCALARLDGPLGWSWQRMLALVLDGLRPGNAGAALPG